MNMARLANCPTNTLESTLPEADKFKLALKWLRDNPTEQSITAARIWKLQKPKSLQKA